MSKLVDDLLVPGLSAADIRARLTAACEGLGAERAKPIVDNAFGILSDFAAGNLTPGEARTLLENIPLLIEASK